MWAILGAGPLHPSEILENRFSKHELIKTKHRNRNTNFFQPKNRKLVFEIRFPKNETRTRNIRKFILNFAIPKTGNQISKPDSEIQNCLEPKNRKSVFEIRVEKKNETGKSIFEFWI